MEVSEEFVDHVLMIDSRDRAYNLYPVPNDYRMELPREYKNVISAKLVNIDLPLSFFVFSADANNTSIDMRLYAAGGGTLLAARAVTLPDGNYDASTIIVALKAAVETAFQDFSATFTVSVNTSTLRLSIDSDQGYQMELDSTRYQSSKPTEWSLGYFLGFEKGSSMRSAQLRSPNIIALNPWMYMLMEIDGLNAVDRGSSGGSEYRSAFAKLTLSGNTWDMITLHRSSIVTGERPLNPMVDIRHIYVRFRFHDGRLVNFNNVEHSFTIQLRCKENVMKNIIPSFAQPQARR